MSCSRTENMRTTETKAKYKDAFLLSHLTCSPCAAEDKEMCEIITCVHAYIFQSLFLRTMSIFLSNELISGLVCRHWRK